MILSYLANKIYWFINLKFGSIWETAFMRNDSLLASNFIDSANVHTKGLWCRQLCHNALFVVPDKLKFIQHKKGWKNLNKEIMYNN